jgi:hypothetical protein
MATLMDREHSKQHAHELIDLIPPDQMIAALRFLEFLLIEPAMRKPAAVPEEDEEISLEEEQAVARSKEWFKHNEGIPFEQIVAELGFTMDQIRSHRLDDEQDSAA